MKLRCSVNHSSDHRSKEDANISEDGMVDPQHDGPGSADSNNNGNGSSHPSKKRCQRSESSNPGYGSNNTANQGHTTHNLLPAQQDANEQMIEIISSSDDDEEEEEKGESAMQVMIRVN